MNFELIAQGLPVQPTLDYLDAHPELWDQITERQIFPGSPHHDTKCIFLRWCPGQTMRDVFYQLEAVDYPAAKDLAPAIAPLFDALLDAVPFESIGRVMLVSLKPGGSIDEHFDSGNYAERLDRFHVVLRSDDGNQFTVGGENFHARPGEAFWFNVKASHHVRNDSGRDRVHLIVDLVAPTYRAKRGIYYQRERIQDLWEDINPLLAEHWREIAHYQDIPLNPDVVFYNWAEENNRLRCYTARDGGKLVGYGVFIIGPNRHYVTSIQAQQDVLFVLPEYRKRSVGYRLIKFCDRELKAEGMQVVYQHVKHAHDFGPLLERLGYVLVDHIYGKRLDQEP